jgi:hypothetical protein
MGVDTSGVDQFRRILNEGQGNQRETQAVLDSMNAPPKPGETQAVLDLLNGRPQRGEKNRVVSIEDGTGNALSTRVNADNNLGTEARFGRTSVVTGDATVTTSSVAIISQRAGRLTLTIQNLDDLIAIYFHLGSGIATTNDLRLDPGQMYSLPPGVAFEGPVSFVTPSGSAPLAYVEYSAGA